ncbi:MAG: tetratricopeptide repeat protein [Paracoccaceae bacterium]
MTRRLSAAAGLVLAALAAAAGAQTGLGPGASVEDLRFRLGVIDAELADIRARLGQSGLPAPAAGGAGELGLRIDRLEAEIRRLTGQVEELAFAQRQIAEDAARRLGDIEFRLTELEGGDVSVLAPQEPLGGAAVVAPPAAGAGEPAVSPQAAVSVSEEGDLDRAIADIEQGRFDQGEDRLRRFLDDYPGSPLTARAHFWLGRSHFVRGNYPDAARRFLEGYNTDRQGAMAPQNLLQLGITLGRLGQRREACLTLREVKNQFAGRGAEVMNAADAEADALACG